MADFNTRGASDDCEGEGGERGERGKRGHRGHRGHHGHDGHDGATGPTGPAAADTGIVLDPTPPTFTGNGSTANPLQVINVAPVPFSTTVTVIYARPTGNDATGDGSLANPYATFQRAMLDVPLFIQALQRYYVDITGVNELLPPDYAIPPIKAAGYYTVLGADPLTGARRFSASLNIRADLAPLSTIPFADTTLTPADVVSMSSDPVTGLRLIVVNKLFAPGVLRGALIVGASPEQRSGPIFDQLDNTPLPGQTTLVIATTTTNPAFAAPFLIGEPGATLTAQNGDEAFTGLGVKHVDSVFFEGISFRNADPGVNSYGVMVVDSNVCIFGLCDIEGIYVGPNTEYFFPNATVFRNKTIESEGQTELILGACVLLDMATLYTYDVNQIQLLACGVRNCAAIGPRPAVTFTPAFTTIGSGIATKILVANTEIQNSVADTDFGTLGYGVLSIGPLANIANSRISGCAADAIYFNGGNGVVQLVDGAGNVGVGILADKGAQVSVDATTTVTGTLGDVKSGSLAPASYATLAVSAQYDLPPKAASLDVATGARIFRV